MRSRRSRRPIDQLPESHTLECQHCYKAYVPVKRGTQKFCSSSCRSTHSKQQKAGTLGKITSLSGPSRGGLSLLETTLAAGAGAAAANAGEYFLVTRHLMAQSKQQSQQLAALTALLQHSAQVQNHLQQQLTQVTQALALTLQTLGLAPDRIEQVLLPPVLAAPSASPVALPANPTPEPALTPEEQAIYAQLVAAFASSEPAPEARSARARPPKKEAEPAEDQGLSSR